MFSQLINIETKAYEGRIIKSNTAITVYLTTKQPKQKVEYIDLGQPKSIAPGPGCSESD